MNKKIKLMIIGLVVFGVGFFAGMEYKAYQVRTAFEDAFSGKTTTNSSATNTTAMEEAKKENMVVIQKAVGDEIQLATLKMKVTGVEEKQSISNSYSSPRVAKEGTRFVVVSMDVTNTTNSAFTLTPDFLLVDNQKREFSTYENTIGSIDNYFDYRELPPSVKESGVFVYEIPTNATQYNLVISKAGSKELYKIVLK